MALFRFGRSQDDSEKEIPRTESTSPESDQASRPGFLARLRSGLERTRQVLVTDVRDLFKREGRLVDDGFLEELRRVLVQSDIGPSATDAILADIAVRYRAESWKLKRYSTRFAQACLSVCDSSRPLSLWQQADRL